MRRARAAVFLCFLATAIFAAAAAGSEEFQAAMEANNAKWLQAYNTQDAKTLGTMYAEDAILIAAGGQPISGFKGHRGLLGGRR